MHEEITKCLNLYMIFAPPQKKKIPIFRGAPALSQYNTFNNTFVWSIYI